MQQCAWKALIVAFLCLVGALAETTDSNPLQKVVALISTLQGQVVQDGEEADRAFDGFRKQCKNQAESYSREIDRLAGEKDKLTATIERETSEIQDATDKIAEYSQSIATDEADLKATKALREKERSEFEESEGQLMEAIDMLGRAMEVLEREMDKTGAASLLQSATASKALDDVMTGLTTVISSAGFAAKGAAELAALLQQQGQQQEDPAVYKGHSRGVIDTLEELHDKGQTSLRELRRGEETSKHNSELLEQSLSWQITKANKDLLEEKANLQESQEQKAAAEGELVTTTKDLTDAKADLKEHQLDCLREAAEHEAAQADRQAELKALNTAKKAIQNSMSEIQLPANSNSEEDGDNEAAVGDSFMQVRATTSALKVARRRAMLGVTAADAVQQLADQHHSAALAQLASRLRAMLRYRKAGIGEEPFRKVKGLIKEMITKLTRELEQDATEKTYCDKELKETNEKNDELKSATESLKAKIDEAESSIAMLGKQIKLIQREMVDEEEEWDEAQKTRQEEHAAYEASSADLKKALKGIQTATQVLQDYYGSKEQQSLLQTGTSDSAEAVTQYQQPSGAGSSIIGLLQVCESEFAKTLSTVESEESEAQQMFEKEQQAFKVQKAQKGKDVEYKGAERTATEKTLAELNQDYATESDQLQAVQEYLSKVRERCIAKEVPYSERKAKREAEIKGLEEALASLKLAADEGNSGEFLQRVRKHRHQQN